MNSINTTTDRFSILKLDPENITQLFKGLISRILSMMKSYEDQIRKRPHTTIPQTGYDFEVVIQKYENEAKAYIKVC